MSMPLISALEQALRNLRVDSREPGCAWFDVEGRGPARSIQLDEVWFRSWGVVRKRHIRATSADVGAALRELQQRLPVISEEELFGRTSRRAA